MLLELHGKASPLKKPTWGYRLATNLFLNNSSFPSWLPSVSPDPEPDSHLLFFAELQTMSGFAIFPEEELLILKFRRQISLPWLAQQSEKP